MNKVIKNSQLEKGEFYYLADTSNDRYGHKDVSVYNRHCLVSDYFIYIHRWADRKQEAPNCFISFKYTGEEFDAYIDDKNQKYTRRWANMYLKLERRSKV